MNAVQVLWGLSEGIFNCNIMNEHLSATSLPPLVVRLCARVLECEVSLSSWLVDSVVWLFGWKSECAKGIIEKGIRGNRTDQIVSNNSKILALDI
jgi:hypothetical protein